MNREFEFRAWLTKYNKMVKIYSWNIWQEYFMCSEYDSEFYLEETPIMQYTGLKDMWEKEIYEGDIVKLRANHGIGVVKYYDEWGAFVVEYIKHRQLAVLGMNYYKEDIEILGNIYENSELIKEVRQ